MTTKVVMPRLSLTMKDGTVGKWYKREGQTVEKGEPIAEVVSEKATYDLESPATGILRKIFIEEGVDAPVNAVLAVITSADEPLPDIEMLQEAPKEAERRIVASPAAKRLAREHGTDLSIVKGSGPDGRITEDDVKRLIEDKKEKGPKVKEIIALSGFRKTTAERLSRSFRTAPHSTVVMEVEAFGPAEIRKKTGVSYTAVIVKAAAQVLAKSPQMNSTLEDDRLKIFEDVNIGVAVATENGLLVPVIHNADKKSLTETESELKELSEKARQGRLSIEEVTGGTFTITNLGMYGVDFFTPIINPPEAAILGVGRIVEKPIVSGGKVEIRPMVMLSLSYDHRIVDGAPAAEFLNRVKERIETIVKADD